VAKPVQRSTSAEHLPRALEPFCQHSRSGAAPVSRPRLTSMKKSSSRRDAVL